MHRNRTWRNCNMGVALVRTDGDVLVGAVSVLCVCIVCVLCVRVRSIRIDVKVDHCLWLILCVKCVPISKPSLFRCKTRAPMDPDLLWKTHMTNTIRPWSMEATGCARMCNYMVRNTGHADVRRTVLHASLLSLTI